MKNVYIVSMARTPIGSFLGKLSGFSAVELGSKVIKAAVERAGIDAGKVEEVFMGNVLQANTGQAPARQAALAAGLPDSVPCTTVNKVCASGMKAIMFATQAIRLGDAAVVRDGLQDPYDGQMMGTCGDLCASGTGFSREDQDNYAIASYKRAAEATEKGWLKNEIIPVEVPQRKADPITMTEDEDFRKVKFEKIPTLRPAFAKDGTVTAANASNINDGAAALVLMSEEKMNELGVKPLAKILSYADAAQEPKWFTTTPAKALPKAIEKADLTVGDIDLFEINEAFSVVALANMKELGIQHGQTNVFGGGVSIGHPIGVSGARIICTLISALTHKGGNRGAAGICNGGGGASAMVIELV